MRHTIPFPLITSTQQKSAMKYFYTMTTQKAKKKLNLKISSFGGRHSSSVTNPAVVSRHCSEDMYERCPAAC